MRSLRISIAAIVASLISIGIIMIYSSSGVYALQELGDASYFLNRHLLFLMIGLVATSLVVAIDYRDIQKWSKPIMLFAVFLLFLVLIPEIGKASYGARRWFRIGSISFQPSEFAKLAVIIYTADFLTRKKDRIQNFWLGFMPMMMVLGVVCILILKQPDLGNAVLIAAMVMIMMFIAGAKTQHIVGFGLLSLPALYWLVVRVPYRMKRIAAFWDPWQDPLGVGFQLSQSQIALGSGGLWGVGLGKSVQKLFYLPAAHTDFILSIIGEELGLLGTFSIIFLFAAFIWQGARIAKRTLEPFGYYVCIGIIAMLGLQALVNIGVSIGALPTKGLPLPFISYGGSALVFHMISIGLLLNISRVQDL